MHKSMALKLAMGVLLLAAVVASLWLLPVKEYVIGLSNWADEFGPAGAFLVAALYLPACILLIPGTILSLSIGFAFGVLWGTVAVSLGSVAGATAAMLAGRTLLRKPVERRLAGSPRFAALDRAVAEQGFQIVLLTRLSPLFPFNLLNYAYGLTGVSLRDYVLASWIGMLPGTIVYVYLGSAAGRLAESLAGDVSTAAGPRAMFWVGLVAAVAVVVLVTRAARRALDESVGLPSDGKREDAAADGESATPNSNHQRAAGAHDEI